MHAWKEGCFASDTVQIRFDEAKCEYVYLVPNAFSPNGDGVNDLFLPFIEDRCSDVHNYELIVYNRFGQQVFASHKKGWDGLHNGLPADGGTYMYHLKFYAGPKKKAFSKKDDLILIR